MFECGKEQFHTWNGLRADNERQVAKLEGDIQQKEKEAEENSSIQQGFLDNLKKAQSDLKDTQLAKAYTECKVEKAQVESTRLKEQKQEMEVRIRALEEEVKSMQDSLAQREKAASEEQTIEKADQQEEGLWEDEVLAELIGYCE